MTFRVLWLSLILTSIIACNPDENTTSSMSDDTVFTGQLFKKVDAFKSGVFFQNGVDESWQRNVFTYNYFYGGSGVTLGDINNDGLTDIFFTGNDVPNKLYINKGNMEFEDISLTAFPFSLRWATSATMADVNNDGYLDIYVCNGGPNFELGLLKNELYINNKDLTFTDQAEKMGVADYGRSSQASFFDYDRDGDLDLWVNNQSVFQGRIDYWMKMNGKDEVQDTLGFLKLYRNDGGTFKDVSKEANIHKLAFGMGLSTEDFNNDGFIDVLVMNDFFIPDYYYINNGDGTFTDMGKNFMAHTSYHSHGCDVADVNNDGILDIAIAEIADPNYYYQTIQKLPPNTLYKVLSEYYKFTPQSNINSLQLGSSLGTYQEVSRAYGTSKTGWSWGVLLADFDNDGFKDQYITNGILKNLQDRDFKKVQHLYETTPGAVFTESVYKAFMENLDDYPLTNKLLRNQKGAAFKDMSSTWIKEKAGYSYGAAYGDLDNDGDLDLVINHLQDTASIYENQITKTNFLQVQLVDNQKPSANSHAVLKIYQKDKMQRVDYSFDRGYGSGMQQRVHFGLSNKGIDSLVVRWKDGLKYKIENPEINRILTINRNQATATRETDTYKIAPYLDITNGVNLNVFTSSLDFFDNKTEPNLPYEYSNMGPAITVGDVDGDGDEDFFIGANGTSAPRLMIAEGTSHTQLSIPAFIMDQSSYDLGATFIDIDNDGDLDLYVAAGGGAILIDKKEQMEDRLYINSGNGYFSKSQDILPIMQSSTKSITQIDINDDGYMDLFVAGRNVPGSYPENATSYLLINEKGKFRIEDISAIQSNMCGMITDTQAVDVNGDGKQELVLVGEWCAPQIYSIDNGKLKLKQIAKFDDLIGWWQSIAAVDIDNDGDMDLVLGNIGLNIQYQTSKENPLKAIRADFDNNGNSETFMIRKQGDIHVPLISPDEALVLVPNLSSKMESFDNYAELSAENILGKVKVDSAFTKVVKTFESVILVNEGNYKFKVKTMPYQVQWAPVMDIMSDDINNDGNIDLVIAGNIFDVDPNAAAYDAGRGLILYGKGDATFEVETDPLSMGINLDKNVRALQPIKLGAKQKGFLVANNNGPLQLFLWRDDLYKK